MSDDVDLMMMMMISSIADSFSIDTDFSINNLENRGVRREIFIFAGNFQRRVIDHVF